MATATPKAVAPDPEEVVADEAPRRTPAAIAAILAGLLTIGVSVYIGIVYADLPSVTVAETLAPLVNEGTPPEVSPVIVELAFVDENAVAIVLGAILNGLGLMAAGFALSLLVRAARHRKPEIPPFLPVAVLLAGILLALANATTQILSVVSAGDFVSGGDRSQAAVDGLGGGVGLQILQSVGLFALFALSFGGYLYGALNAMRVGLLTRFMGVLGIIVGVAPILGVLVPAAGSGFPLVQAFWLIGLGLIYLDRWPGGVPPAWSAGEARPWPTQLELREARDRERLEREGQAPSDEPDAEAEAEPEAEPGRTREPLDAPGATQPRAPTRAHTSSKKRKRKRR
jgi:hypothetical protein